jgi:putative peptide zinc metalloprotease protein
VELLERPSLAPNVGLVSEVQGSGFADRQWLVECDGRFIQLTELLYRIAEQANGERTPEDIASGVTAVTDWSVTADNVRQLIETKLVPLGLIAPSDGSSVPRRDAGGGSALQVNLRTRVLSPRVIEPIARALQFLFAPAVLIPLLVVMAAAHAWLYFVHGVADALRATLYTPGGLVLALALMMVSGVFHEFGHAAGLQYGGGRARGMGAGLYLIYPTFYTDTTDAYRLNRVSRLRTDLGGIYFHLIFALGLVALYFASGQEILLAVVALISGDVLYQLMPYVRLDGYWVVADLTGIPDMFSGIRPFLRSARPGVTPGESRLPRLKPWVKVAFIAYIVLTLPVLGLFLLLIVVQAPRVVTIGLDAFIYQTSLLSTAWTTGEVLLLAAVTSQMLLLTLSLLALAYVLFNLVRPLIRGLWNWSTPTPARRVAAAFALAVMIAGVGLLWFPWLPVAALPTGPADTESFAIVERTHVSRPVAYPQSPPVGGDHAPIWQNCGFYDLQVRNENAVHSLEHGAVWITYRPDVSPAQVSALRDLAHRQGHILVSPYPDLPAPLIASAWGKQLRLDSSDDPALDEFVRAFRLGRQAPEWGERCDGGVGDPL